MKLVLSGAAVYGAIAAFFASLAVGLSDQDQTTTTVVIVGAALAGAVVGAIKGAIEHTRTRSYQSGWDDAREL